MSALDDATGMRIFNWSSKTQQPLYVLCFYSKI